MDQTSNYGLLINQNTKLQRKQFIEMTKLLGIKVKYRYPLRNQNYTNSGELFSSYSAPIDVGCILNDHPDIKTTKKLGWNSELVDGAMVISLPYELENLQVGCLVELPSGFDNTPSRLFRITKIEDAKIRKQLLNETWTRLNNEFPNWKKNEILKKDKSAKNFYMKTVNKFTYKIYCAIFSA